MRVATQGSRILEENGTPFGIDLGFDYTAEHEWGIDGILGHFDVGGGSTGLEARKTRARWDGVRLFPFLALPVVPRRMARDEREAARTEIERKYGKYDAVMIGIDKPEMTMLETIEIANSMALRGDEELRCAWDSDSFAIRARGERARGLLVDLEKAFQTGDAAVFSSFPDDAGPRRASGLAFAIASRIPAAIGSKLAEMDADAAALAEAHAKTGIEWKILEAGLGFIALKPAWKRTAPGAPREIAYWLQPTRSTAFKSGWYSLRDLLDWVDGKGKVLREEPEAVASFRIGG